MALWISDTALGFDSHEKGFTSVCKAELGEAARPKPESDKRNTEAVGLSADDLQNHRTWIADIRNARGHAVDFPILAGADRAVSSRCIIPPSITDPQEIAAELSRNSIEHRPHLGATPQLGA